MKCESCGYENREGSRFCEKCGSMLKIERKCPSCGNIVGEGALFCQFCGTRLDGKKAPTASDGFAMGDKNVIAGDVFGSKEDIHISGNATIVKNTDDTKKLQVCSVCGKHVMASEGYTCPECGRFVCSSCYDSEHGMCVDCRSSKLANKEAEYVIFLKQAITGPLTDLQMNNLVKKGADFEVGPAKANTIIAEVLKAIGTNVRSTSLSDIERSIVDEIEADFYEKWDDAKATNECFTKISPIFEKHGKDQRVIDVLLPIAVKCDMAKARQIVDRIDVPSVAVFCARVDLAMKSGNVVDAVNIMEDAKMLFRDDVRIQVKEIELLLACGAVLKQKAQMQKAQQLAEEFEEKGSKLERSLIFRMRAHAGAYRNSSAREDLPKSKDLYSGYCADWANLIVGTNSCCQYCLMDDAIKACPINGHISVMPGIYTESWTVEKDVVIEGPEFVKYTEIDKLYGSIDLRRRRRTENEKTGTIKWVDVDLYEERKQAVKNLSPEKYAIFFVPPEESVTLGATAMVKHCIFIGDKERMSFEFPKALKKGSLIPAVRLKESASLERCVVLFSYGPGICIEDGQPTVKSVGILFSKGYGVRIADGANPIISRSTIYSCSVCADKKSIPLFDNCQIYEYGLDLYCENKNLEIYGIKVINGPIVTFDGAECKISHCEAREFTISGDVTLSGCIAGRYIINGGKPTLQNCTADSSYAELVPVQNGFEVLNSACPQLISCKAVRSRDCGFVVKGKAQGEFVDCISEESRMEGFFVAESANPVMRKCVAKSSGNAGFTVCGNAKGEYIGCTSEKGKKSGYFVCGKAQPKIQNSISKQNNFGFNIGGESSGEYTGCTAQSCKSSGFYVSSPSNPVVEGCVSNGNSARGFWIDKTAAVKMNNCKALNNSSWGYYQSAGSKVSYTGCSAEKNKEGGFAYEPGADILKKDGCKSDTKRFGLSIFCKVKPEQKK